MDSYPVWVSIKVTEARFEIVAAVKILPNIDIIVFSFTFSGPFGLLSSNIRMQNTALAGGSGAWGVLHFPVPLMNRLRQTESAVFQQVHYICEGSPFKNIQRSKQLWMCRVAAVKHLLVHWYSVGMFTFSGPLGLLGSDIQKHNTSLACARGVRGFIFSSISHERTQSSL